VSRRVAGALIALGGALMAVGPILDFVTVQSDLGVERESRTFNGFATRDGSYYVAAGIALALLALVVVALWSAIGRRILGSLGIVVAGFMTYGALQDLTSLSGLPRGVTGTAEIGLYAVLAGGVLALVGSVVALFTSQEVPASAPTRG